MPIGEIFHSEIPALAVAEGNELADQHGVILATDARKFSVSRSAALRPVAARASREILSAAVQIRLGLQGFEKFLIGRGHCERNGRKYRCRAPQKAKNHPPHVPPPISRLPA
jgi:hypothetical protein